MKKNKERIEESRPTIPEPIQRAVRQRCFFGCVKCGLPLYEYHHIIPYPEVQRHDEDNLTLLCNRHHREATNRLLTPEQVRTANSSPFNAASGVSSPYELHFEGTKFRAEIGTCIFLGGEPYPGGGYAFIPISVDDMDIVWFQIDEMGRMFLHMNIFDENNSPLLKVEANVLSFKTDTWDIVFKGKKLTLRQAARDIFLEIEFCPPNCIRIVRGRLLYNGIEILIRKSYILVLNNGQAYSNCEFNGGLIGFHLGRNWRQYRCLLHSVAPSKRYDFDRDAALESEKIMIQKWAEIEKIMAQNMAKSKK